MLVEAEFFVNTVDFGHNLSQTLESFKEVFTPRRIRATVNSFRIEENEQILFEGLVVSLKRVVLIKGLDPIVVDFPLINFFNIVFRLIFTLFVSFGFFFGLSIVTSFLFLLLFLFFFLVSIVLIVILSRIR